jgi:hypothetical protein
MRPWQRISTLLFCTCASGALDAELVSRRHENEIGEFVTTQYQIGTSLSTTSRELSIENTFEQCPTFLSFCCFSPSGFPYWLAVESIERAIEGVKNWSKRSKL